MNESASMPQPGRAVLSLIGGTPLVPLHFGPENVTLLAKCEFLNPSGSIKDRLAKHVLLDAEERGLLRPESVILECSSGNTGIALSMVGAAMGYRVTILMSAGASEERRKLIRQLGADLILFDSGGQYQTGIELSREMAAADPRYFLPRQFDNPLNASRPRTDDRPGNPEAGRRADRCLRARLRHRRHACGLRQGDQASLAGRAHLRHGARGAGIARG